MDHITFEGGSYLPPLNNGQIERMVQDILMKGYLPMIEYTDHPSLDNVYWQLWGMDTEEMTAQDVVAQIELCKQSYPYHSIRLIGYDKERQVAATSVLLNTEI